MQTKYHMPKNEEPIQDLYVVLSMDEDGCEGVVAYMTEYGSFPFVFNRISTLEKTIPAIKKISKDTNRKLYIHKFNKSELMQVIDETKKDVAA